MYLGTNILLKFLICVQALTITTESRPVKRFTLATHSALSVGFIFVEAAYCRNGLEMVASLSVLIALLSLPRRPTVFHRGHQVDQEYGVSILERYSFSWVSDIFSLAKAGPLRIQDLPSLGYHMRVCTLKARYAAHNSPRLWMQLLRTFGHQLVQQWILTALKALCGFGSRFAIYQLLRVLDCSKSPTRGTTQGVSVVSVASFWALALGLSIVMESLVGTRLSWFSETRLAMPVIALLNALVFEKSTRVQISHEASRADGSEKQKKDGRNTIMGANQSLTNMMTNDR